MKKIKKIKECKHNKKVFADFILMSDPPLSKWICKDCGYEGTTVGEKTIVSKYDEIKEKFKNSKPII